MYGTGHRTSPIGVIFENWREGEFDTSLPFVYGLDFGYSPDPTVMVKVAVDKKARKVYVDEQFYNIELSFKEIRARINIIAGKSSLIVGDSAEKRIIQDLRSEGFNIHPTLKYNGSVIDGIRKLQDYEIIVTPNSSNVKKSLNNYVWHDKKSDTPSHDYSDPIDATRYGFMELMSDSKLVMV